MTDCNAGLCEFLDCGTLSHAVYLAVGAHQGQRDKAGQPYILHPLRVMLMFSSDPERIVAVLHDVVEDTEETLDSLRNREGFSKEIVEAVDAISRREDETYKDYIRRCELNPLARRVKLGDLADNLSPERLFALEEGERKGMEERYSWAWKELTVSDAGFQAACILRATNAAVSRTLRRLSL